MAVIKVNGMSQVSGGYISGHNLGSKQKNPKYNTSKTPNLNLDKFC